MVSPEPQRCHLATQIRLDSETGYLASLVTVETGCGSWDHPWVIEAKAGQKINITLMDFTELSAENTPVESVICEKYATIREPKSSRTVDICGGLNAPSQNYMSITNELQIAVSAQENYYFLLKYEGGYGDGVGVLPRGNTRHITTRSSRLSYVMICT